MEKDNTKLQGRRKQWEEPNTKSDKIDGDETKASTEAKFGNAGESNKKSILINKNQKLHLNKVKM